MGNQCTGMCSGTSIKKPLHSYAPSDIENFRPQRLDYKLPKIVFEGEIFNIQIINCPEGVYSLNFQIADVITITLPEKVLDRSKIARDSETTKQLRWKIHEKFGFTLTEYEIRSRFLIIQVFGEKKIKINELVINLYKIATGPQHHDLELKLGNSKFARLKFDFKISEVIDVNLNIEKIRIEFDNDLRNQQVDYSFKIIRNNDVTCYSQSDNPKTVQYVDGKNLYRQTTLQDECQSPLKFRKNTSSNKMIKKDLCCFADWGYEEGKERVIMEMNTKLLSNDINKSFLTMMVWKIERETNLSKIEKKQNGNGNLFCNTLINFKKLFQKPRNQKKVVINTENVDMSEVEQKISFDMEERQMCLEEKLWGQDGTAVGRCQIFLDMTNAKFEKQLQACALTEDGVVNMSILFKNYLGKNTKKYNKKITQILEKYETIDQLVKKLTKIPTDNYNSRAKIMDLEERILQLFQEISNNILSSLNESFVISCNSNEKQVMSLIDDQLLLIQLMNKLFYFINDNTIYSSICWQIVLMIMKRGEFYLENIGFLNVEKNNRVIYERKKHVAVKYENVLYKYFILALKCSTISFRNSTNTHVEAFKAYCYIKIPKFRQRLIDSIQKSYDQEIIELKLQHLDSVTSDFSSLLKNNKAHLSLNLDWQKYFYNEIENNTQNALLQREMLEQMENCAWIEEISKRKEVFFDFTAELVKRLNELSHRIKLWNWHYFPGYTKIVRGFMVEMKKRKLMEYPTLMIKTSSQLLANEQLINILMPLIIEKTNSFSKPEVLRCLTILDNFFTSLTQNKTHSLPRTFNYLYFFKTIKLICQVSENTQILIKLLILIYDYYEWMSPEWRDNITMYFMGKVFFKFFFHWSFQVRIIFYNFLIIKIKYLRIQQMSKLPINAESIQMNSKIAERYDQISIILLNAEKIKRQEVMDYRVIYEKDLFKKMKKKIKGKIEQHHSRRKNSLSSAQKCTSTYDKENSLKQTQYGNRTSLFSLQNLLIPRLGSKKLSCPEQQTRNKSSTLFQFRQFQQDESKQEKLQIIRGNSFCLDINTRQQEVQNGISQKQTGHVVSYCNKNNEEETSLEEILDHKLNKLATKMSRQEQRKNRLSLQLANINTKLNYKIYNKQDHNLMELTRSQLNYVLRGIQEYRQTLNEINKYYEKTGNLPKRQLDVQQFTLDSQ